VREALSKLQAGGLVETLHGVGTFVLQPRAGGVFRLDPGEIAASVDVLAVLELRISLETESAGLAASRRTDEQLVAMRQALDDFEHNVTVAGDTVAPDFRFTCRSRNRPATRTSPTSCGTWAPRSFRARASAPSARTRAGRLT
jgi:GntR family transcriptional repressor for pyruvate dehydrogenase complex